jgi:hypothetical protein
MKVSRPQCVMPDGRAINGKRPSGMDFIPVVHGSEDVEFIYEKAKQVVSQMSSQDYLLVTEHNPLATTLCIAVWLTVHSGVTLVYYNRATDKWHTFHFDRSFRRQDIEAFLDTIKAAKEA